jgi:hypothetical protein
MSQYVARSPYVNKQIAPSRKHGTEKGPVVLPATQLRHDAKKWRKKATLSESLSLGRWFKSARRYHPFSGSADRANEFVTRRPSVCHSNSPRAYTSASAASRWRPSRGHACSRSGCSPRSFPASPGRRAVFFRVSNASTSRPWIGIHTRSPVLAWVASLAQCRGLV